MLENAVFPLPELRLIKSQADQHKALTGTALSYEQYLALVLSAATAYDVSLAPDNTTMRRTKARHMYEHDIIYDNNSQDIDTDVTELSRDLSADIQVNMNRLKLNKGQWTRLSTEAQQIWDQLSDEAKQIILESKVPRNPAD